MPEKEQFQLEYIIRSSLPVLYNCISTPSGLSEWFSDDVNIKDDIYSFFWDGAEERARLITKRTNEFIKFQWADDEDDDSYFEIRIKTDPLTKEVALIITDFASDNEKEEAVLLWNAHVNKLMRILGS